MYKNTTTLTYTHTQIINTRLLNTGTEATTAAAQRWNGGLPAGSHALFVTWTMYADSDAAEAAAASSLNDSEDDDDGDGDADADSGALRGCIGTFSPRALGDGLREYAAISGEIGSQMCVVLFVYCGLICCFGCKLLTRKCTTLALRGLGDGLREYAATSCEIGSQIFVCIVCVLWYNLFWLRMIDAHTDAYACIR
jgi:hypothetical protein